jgi:hypothetical protein
MAGILINRAVSVVEHVAYVSVQLGCIVFRLIAERKCVGGWVRLSTGCVWWTGGELFVWMEWRRRVDDDERVWVRVRE